VRIFVMGANRWRDEHDWPLARAVHERWFLHGAGDAGGEGELSRRAPVTTSRPTATPSTRATRRRRSAVPPRCRVASCARTPARSTSARSKAAPTCSCTPASRCAQDLEVTGPLSVTLHAATSAHDADFVAKLCDVHPDGFSLILAEGVLRARFREGLERECAVEPGTDHTSTRSI
jgi:putative CocE/NonD family hydrolase